MVERLRKILDRIVEIWKNWSRKQKTIIISSVAVVIIAVTILIFVMNRTQYAILTTASDYEQLNSITTILKDGAYTYRVKDNSLLVEVEKSKLTDAKMAIASADIKSSGYSFEDAMKSSFTTTDSDKNKQYEHYLESKFAEDLTSMDGIKRASVTVDIAQDTNSFYKQTSESSVSVLLETSKNLSDDTAESIANFLATAVGNKSTDNITIVSSDGTTLFSGPSNASSGSGVSYAGKQKYKGQIESTTRSSLKQGLLATGLYDDAYITLNYVLNWDAVNKIATEYSTQGDDQAIFGESYEEKSQGTNAASGTPGTVSNDDDTTYELSNGSGSSSNYEVKKYQYMPNELVTTTTQEPGSIVYNDSTLAVTFIRNVVYNQKEMEDNNMLNGMTWEQFKQANADSTAIDVDNNWVNYLSRGTGINANNITVLAYQRPFFEDSPATSVFSTLTFWIQILLALAILGLLAFVIIRSARPLTVEEKEPEISVEEMLATTREAQPKVDDIDMQEKSETRRAIEKFVDENPKRLLCSCVTG